MCTERERDDCGFHEQQEKIKIKNVHFFKEKLLYLLFCYIYFTEEIRRVNVCVECVNVYGYTYDVFIEFHLLQSHH